MVERNAFLDHDKSARCYDIFISADLFASAQTHWKLKGLMVLVAYIVHLLQTLSYPFPALLLRASTDSLYC